MPLDHGVGERDPHPVQIRPIAWPILPDLARLTSVIDTANQCLGQPEPLIAGLKQNRAAVGSGMVLVKFGDDRLARQIRGLCDLCFLNS